MTPEQIKEAYEDRIMALMRSFAEELESAGYRVTGVQDWTGEEHAWRLVVFSDPDDVEIVFTILESEQREGEPGGVAFGIDITTSEGEVLGGYIPFNYTEELWVDRKNEDAIEDRFLEMEVLPSGAIAELLEEKGFGIGRKRWRP